jgi:hypothetical protein
LTDMTAHLTRQAAVSRALFGPGPRTEGVSEHIREELKEVAHCYDTDFKPVVPHPPLAQNSVFQARHVAASKEWADVAILGLDGLMRAIWSAHPTLTAAEVAHIAVTTIIQKQGKNERREWPDWRTVGGNQPIKHKRGSED